MKVFIWKQCMERTCGTQGGAEQCSMEVLSAWERWGRL